MQLVLQRRLRVLKCGVLCLGVGVEAVPGAVSGRRAHRTTVLHQVRPHLQQPPQRRGVNNCGSGRSSRAQTHASGGGGGNKVCRAVSKHLATPPAAELARSGRQAACASWRVPRDVRTAPCRVPAEGLWVLTRHASTAFARSAKHALACPASEPKQSAMRNWWRMGTGSQTWRVTLLTEPSRRRPLRRRTHLTMTCPPTRSWCAGKAAGGSWCLHLATLAHHQSRSGPPQRWCKKCASGDLTQT